MRIAALALLLASAVLLSGTPVAQVLGPTIAEAVPHHPSSHERVGIRVRGPTAVPVPGLVALARGTLQNGILQVDYVITDAPEDYPDFHRVGDLRSDVAAWFGPLSPGTYAVRGTAIAHVDAVVVALPFDGDDVIVSDSAAPVALVDAVELYNGLRDRYFMTADAGEAALLLGGLEPGWQLTGQSFKLYREQQSDGRGTFLCRLASVVPGLDAHFFSVDVLECASARESGAWRSEFSAVEAAFRDTLTGECAQNQQPVFRLWNPRNGDHRWVVDAALRARLVAQGWVSEGYGDAGVAMCAPVS